MVCCYGCAEENESRGEKRRSDEDGEEKGEERGLQDLSVRILAAQAAEMGKMGTHDNFYVDPDLDFARHRLLLLARFPLLLLWRRVPPAPRRRETYRNVGDL